MTRFKFVVLVGLVLLGTSTILAEEQGDQNGWSYDENLRYENPTGDFRLDIVNRVQVRGVTFDPELGSSGNSFELAHYRLGFLGTAFEDFQFKLQVNFADGSETSEELLEDAWVNYKKHGLAQLWAGQGKVAFGRQFMIESSRLAFVDRSLATERFAHGRDVGFAVIGENKKGTYAYSAGAYNGNGINRDEDENKDYMFAGRLVATPLGPFEMAESDPGWHERKEGQKLALGVSIISNKEGTNSLEEQRTTTANLEFQYRIAGFNFLAEFFTENQDEILDPPGIESEMDGWYAQAGYLFKNDFEIAARYSEILSDQIDDDIQEKGAAVGYYFRGHRAKVQADYRDLEFEGIQTTGNTDATEFRFQLQLIF